MKEATLSSCICGGGFVMGFMIVRGACMSSQLLKYFLELTKRTFPQRSFQLRDACQNGEDVVQGLDYLIHQRLLSLDLADHSLELVFRFCFLLCSPVGCRFVLFRLVFLWLWS